MADPSPNTIGAPMQPEETHRRVLLGFSALAVLVVGMVAMAISAPAKAAPQEDVVVEQSAKALFGDLQLAAKAAIVIDIRSGSVLYEKNADVQLPLASLTKVALALTVAEAIPTDTVVSIPYDIDGAGSNQSLSAGAKWKVQDVIDFTLVESSNSGAEFLASIANSTIHARYPSSSAEEATLWRMNELAKNLGLTQTYFLNASGLDISATQASAYGSARDMATLFAYASAADSSLFAGTARNAMVLRGENGQVASAANTNASQGHIPGLILGKTGTTDLAGGNLAIVFDVGFARPVVAVVLGSSAAGRFTDMEKLVERTRDVISRQ